MTIPELQRRFKRVDIKKAAVSIIADNKEDIVQFNRDQLMDGENKEGKKLKKYKSNSYAARKNKMNPSPGFGNPDLYLTGNFQEAMKLNIQSSRTYDITSTDSKTPDLKKKYGADIFGLQPDSRKEIQETIMNPGLVSHIKTVTGL